uniref:receptor-like protein kinase HSL1 n=1 Tax=Erigeron canadensis TaxID=72917 RepID=UPI001CB9748D|nr:receptor-like protein kinase HSL1 [Erigeron canadensis]
MLIHLQYKPPPENMKTTPFQLSLFTLVIITLTLTSGVTSQSQISELTTLLNLKEAWGNPPTLSHWNNTATSPCNWPEIECRDGSVTVLDFTSKELTGVIPPFISDLRRLEILHLHDNYLTGEFPTVLYNCSSLLDIDISQNVFTGKIPDDVDRLYKVKSVDFGGNNFTGDIPAAIGNLTALTKLMMYQNLFNGSIPIEIGNLSNLETLGLAYNEFADPVIPVEFGNLNKLKVLWMPESNLVGEIPESLSNLVMLVNLDLSLNYLEGEIPQGLFMLGSLEHMYLYKNKLSGGIPYVVQCFNATEIDLSMNMLNGTISDGFGKLEKLQVLNLYSNRFTGRIPDGIADITTLRVFKVFRNNLTGELPAEFGANSKLESFEVSENNLSGKLPENLCAGGSLTGVIAFSNKLTGEIPKSFESCDKVASIQLYDNEFNGEIPSGIWTLLNISSLRLSGNSFTGELPSKVAWNLSRLEISDNKFSGQIPPGISSWVKLNVFKASNNMFSGEIPPEFTSLSELSVLYLDGNSLSGELPSEIKAWNSLTILNLARNKLSGHIPSSISSIQDLQELDLSENEFTGQIPPQLSNLRITSLNLSSNKLNGKIPSAYDNMAYQNSFSNNPNLCTTSQISNLRNCLSKTSHSKKFSPGIIAMITLLSAFVVLVAVLLALYTFGGYQKKKHKRIRTTWKLTSFHKMDFTEENILSCMTEANVIGSGGFGKVYRIPVGQPRGYVAVKRIMNNKKLEQNLEDEFTSEVQILGSIRHSNIVKLLCCLSSNNSKLLVYEYMVHQSLDKWLHGKKRAPEPGLVPQFVLDWPRRLQIAIGAAQGLCYMHHDCSPPIVHRDVKSSNILLDSEFRAKIADFGLAKILEKPKPGEGNMSSVVGSLGYFAPEYAYTTRINERIDVYSFGVVLLELVTGKQPNEGDGNLNLAEWAWKHYGDGDSMVGALDPEIKDHDTYLEEMSTVFKLGLICTSTLPSSRPSMKDVLEILRRCNPHEELPEEMKEGREEFDVAPLLKRESYVTGYHESDVDTKV